MRLIASEFVLTYPLRGLEDTDEAVQQLTPLTTVAWNDLRFPPILVCPFTLYLPFHSSRQSSSGPRKAALNLGQNFYCLVIEYIEKMTCY